MSDKDKNELLGGLLRQRDTAVDDDRRLLAEISSLGEKLYELGSALKFSGWAPGGPAINPIIKAALLAIADSPYVNAGAIKDLIDREAESAKKREEAERAFQSARGR